MQVPTAAAQVAFIRTAGFFVAYLCACQIYVVIPGARPGANMMRFRTSLVTFTVEYRLRRPEQHLWVRS